MKILLSLCVIVIFFPLTIQAQKSLGKKPQWVLDPHFLDKKRSNLTYYFISVPNSGPELKDLQDMKIKALGGYIASENKIEGLEIYESGNTQSGTSYSSYEYKDSVTNQRKVKTFYHKLVDEYWEWDGTKYHYWALFAVSDDDNEPRFDNFTYSSSYGFTPVVMSIIPGLGQIYKGSTIKGICMFAGVAACGIGALVCESQRSDYKNKMKEQPQFAKDYNTKANNWETGRNVCLGAAAAVWIYNIIDAAVAKGARKIVVKPKDGNLFSLYPIATPHSMGLALTYNF